MRRLTRIIAIVIATATIIAACSSSPSLTDAETLWCSDFRNIYNEVMVVAEDLDLKDQWEVFFGNRGIDSDIRIPMGDRPEAEEALEEWEESGWFGEVVINEWYQHPDGIRACKAAYELDSR